MSKFMTNLTVMWGKHQLRAILLLALMQSLIFRSAAQRNDTAAAVIVAQATDNKVEFSSTLRPLRQIAGAPSAYYSYFWEFGDGRFSFSEFPRHIYKDTGIFLVRLFATNNYDDGKPPPSRPRPIRVSSKAMYAANEPSSFFRSSGSIEMKVNRNPRPDEDMVLIMGYRNQQTNTSLDGSLVLFFNEKQFTTRSFDLAEERSYHNEMPSTIQSILALSSSADSRPLDWAIGSGPNTIGRHDEHESYTTIISELIASKQKFFRQHNAWNFKGLQQGEEKYFFLTLYTRPEMIGDTNSTVMLTGLFIPNDPNKGLIEEFSLELQIVASHDPNRMLVKNRRLNYRFVGKEKKMEYTVQFQNTGKGAARNIDVGVNIPTVFDPNSIRVVDFYPKAGMCDSVSQGQSCFDTLFTNDSVRFVFKNVYLPGLRQESAGDPDSTKGFIKYTINFNKKPEKLPFESRATIVFDRNEPILTNSPRAYFKPGISPALMVGYNKPIAIKENDRTQYDYWLIGASISPYAPFKKFLQAELFFGGFTTDEQLVDQVQNKDTVVNGIDWLIISRRTFEKSKILRMEFVPLELRYNLLDFIGGGIGTQLAFDVMSKNTWRTEMLWIESGRPQPVMESSTGSYTKWFASFDYSLFADIQVGKVRNGPMAGIRYLHYFKVPQNRMFLYVGWRL